MSNINTIDLNSRILFAVGSSATGSDQIINDAGANYTEQTLSAATVKVSAANAADTSNGTGAQTVRLYGVDADYNAIYEDVSLNGQTEVATTKSFLFVEKLEVLTVGSGGTNAGIIYVGTGTVTSGVPATKWLEILAGIGTSRAGVMCVPAGYSMIIDYVQLINNTATNACEMKLWTKTAGKPYIQKADASVQGSNFLDFFAKFVLPEKTILKLTGNNGTSTSAISALMNYRLVKN